MTHRIAPPGRVMAFPRKTDCATTAPMPTARPWRRGQAPQPRSGAPKAPGLTAAITVAAPSSRPSIVPDDSTRADTPIKAFATSRIYTSLTDTTATTWPGGSLMIPICIIIVNLAADAGMARDDAPAIRQRPSGQVFLCQGQLPPRLNEVVPSSINWLAVMMRTERFMSSSLQTQW